jgi:hypothetical protein
MKGVARKCSRQEPGEANDWPPPSAPAAVYCKFIRGPGLAPIPFRDDPLTHHYEGITNPETGPTVGTVGDIGVLTMDSDHIGWGLTD